MLLQRYGEKIHMGPNALEVAHQKLLILQRSAEHNLI